MSTQKRVECWKTSREMTKGLRFQVPGQTQGSGGLAGSRVNTRGTEMGLPRGTRGSLKPKLPARVPRLYPTGLESPKVKKKMKRPRVTKS